MGREGQLVPEIFVPPPMHSAVHGEDQSTEPCPLRALDHAAHHVAVVEHVQLEPARAARGDVTYFLHAGRGRHGQGQAQPLRLASL